MTGVNELNDQLEGVTVIKRNGKKVDFDGAKIALAIKNSFRYTNSGYQPHIRSKGVFLCLTTIKV